MLQESHENFLRKTVLTCCRRRQNPIWITNMFENKNYSKNT